MPSRSTASTAVALAAPLRAGVLALACLGVAAACGDDTTTAISSGSGGSTTSGEPGSGGGSSSGSDAASTGTGVASSTTASSGATTTTTSGGGGDSSSSSGGGGAGTGGDTPFTELHGSRPISSDADDNIGSSVAISADGTVIAIGANGEDGSEGGVGATPNDDGDATGAVWIYEQTDDGWDQTYIKAEVPEDGAYFANVALSGDGNTLAVGATGEDLDSGAVHIYVRDGGGWTFEERVQADNAGDDDGFGWALALSADGSTLVIGAPGEDSPATGTDGDGNSDAYPDSGAAYVFTRAGGTWSQQAYLKASNTDGDDAFGRTVAISGDGGIVAIGAPGEDGNATGVDGNGASNLADEAGAVYVFARSGTAWAQSAYVKASNTDTDPDYGLDEFGSAVALSTDGATLVVAAPSEASSSAGVDGDQQNNDRLNSGALYVFEDDGSGWAQTHYVKSPVPSFDTYLGVGLALSGDAGTLVAGEDTAESGAVHVWQATVDSFTHVAQKTGVDAGLFDRFGFDLALSANGSRLLVGTPSDDDIGSFSLLAVP